jgi:hypothetical protein
MHLSNEFPIKNGLKQGDALSPLLFNFALEYAIRKIQREIEIEWDTSASGINLLSENINIIKNIETLLDARKEVVLPFFLQYQTYAESLAHI